MKAIALGLATWLLLVGVGCKLEALASVAETTSDKTLRRSARDAIDSKNVEYRPQHT